MVDDVRSSRYRPGLRAQFGEGADGADRFFRLVFGYCAGNPEWQSSNENRVLRGALQDVVMPHALKVFGAEHSPEAGLYISRVLTHATARFSPLNLRD